MNLHPKQRPLWQRAVALPALTLLLVYKVLRLPRSILPRDIKAIVNNWDVRMFWVLISSGLTRAYIDQPCEFAMPKSCEPKAKVDPQWRLTEEQIRGFYRDGFIGPLDAFAPEEMADFRKDMIEAEKSVCQTYGWVTPRDRHFEMPRLWNYMKHPAITERVAVDEATHENGCLDFIRGGHSSVRTIKFGGEEGFYNAAFSLEFDRAGSEVVRVPCKPGQFIIFTERCIHGSGPNTTDRHRLAFNLRVIPTNVAVYPGVKKYRSVYNGGKYLLDNWGVALLRGEDRHQLSRVRQPAEGPAAPARQAA
ncbi:MAG TPA: phytanoyl-CoA dioxygenase family protein [Lacipirellulaceae bacterium]|nr:phytanoyl-CoA dioxygenase family protein [Lacipirellulaceae bacterium]